jgi:hypothetical protein
MFREINDIELDFVSGGDLSINGCPVNPATFGDLGDIGDFDLNDFPNSPPTTTDPYGPPDDGGGFYDETVSNFVNSPEFQAALQQVLADIRVATLTLNQGTPYANTYTGVTFGFDGGTAFIGVDENDNLGFSTRVGF